MNRVVSIVLLFALFSFFLIAMSSFASYQVDDDLLIESTVDEISQQPLPRKQTDKYAWGIKTSRGWLLIATVIVKQNPHREGFVFEGPSFPSGFYLLPRGVWVPNRDEAIRCLKDDYAKSNFIPASQADGLSRLD